MKKAATASTPPRLEPVILAKAAITSGPITPANLENTENSPKNSEDLWVGISCAKSERDRA